MRKLLLICALILPLFGLACGAKGPPLSIDQVPTELEKAFKSAPEGVRALTQAIGRLIERKQYAPASMQMQAMLGDTTLSKEQRSVIARAMATVNNAMQGQLAIQEAAVAPADNGGKSRPQAPPPDLSGSETTAAEAKATLDLYKRSK